MIDLTFYKYNVKWYNEDDHKVEELCGITVGGSYSDAFARVLEYYGGEGEVEGLYIEAWDVSNCLEMRPEVLRCVEYDEAEIIIDHTVNPDLIPDPAAIDKVAITYDDLTPLEGKAPHAKAYVEGRPRFRAYVDGHYDDIFMTAETDTKILESDWFAHYCKEYGIENIIFEEDLT